jgi:hypothetical protein
MIKHEDVSGQHGVLNDPKGLLSSASARVDMCFYLGFIDDVTRRNAKSIAKVRNAFAHSHKPIDFTNDEVQYDMRDLCALIADPDDVAVFAGMLGGLSTSIRPIKPLDPKIAEQLLSNPRHKFVFGAFWTLLVFHQAIYAAKNMEQMFEEAIYRTKHAVTWPSNSSFLYLKKDQGKLIFDSVVLLET